MYRATPDQNLYSSGPSDQPADLANHSRPIVSSEIQRRTVFSGTGVPCTRSHRSLISEHLSPLAGDSLSLSSDLPPPTVSSLQTTTERSPSSYKEKPRHCSVFSPPHLAGQRPRTLPATEASSRRFSFVSHQRPSRPPPTESSTSDLLEPTIGWPEISPENLAATNSSRA